MPCPVWTPGSEVEALWRTAIYLRRRTSKRKGCLQLPPLWFFTDPNRTPHADKIAEHLPPGCGIVYRGFGRAEARDEAVRLADIARARSLTLLIGQDVALAEAVGAHGVHLPERHVSKARQLRLDHPSWLITVAAHDLLAVRRAEVARCDAVFVSAVFSSRSSSAGRPLGPYRLRALAERTSLPVFALGGVNAKSARRLIGASGLAAIDAFSPTSPLGCLRT